jgi:undecaprenyl-diphosphatase
VRALFTHWGSMPSDHATLYAITTVIAFAVSRRAGVATAVIGGWSVLYRVAFGFHWPSDVVAGALIGTIMGILAVHFRPAAVPYLQPLLLRFERRPALMHALGFVILVDLAQAFAISKRIASLIFHARMFH